jgi:hypothetical protein
MNEERTGKWLRQSIGTYPWSFATQIFRSCKLNHGADRKTFEVMTLPNVLFLVIPLMVAKYNILAIFVLCTFLLPDSQSAVIIVHKNLKLSILLLQKRLGDFLESKNLISFNQGGFRSGYRTTDHIYILKTLINK